MNSQHWRAIVWLRWRLFRNRINRLGWLSRLLLFTLMTLSLIAGALSFLFSIALGIWLLPQQCPSWTALVWDGMVLAFLGVWTIGVLTDLQRSEPLSLDKFLHLPISPQNIFFLNYASSIFNLSLAVFIPMMMGCSLVLAWRYGGLMWSGPMLTLAFFMMVTALTYQFRGWLAALMKNERRRRTILTAITLIVAFFALIPTILDRTAFRANETEKRQSRRVEKGERARLDASLKSGEMGFDEHELRIHEMDRRKLERRQRQWDAILGWAKFANAYVPPLWLAAGIDGAVEKSLPITGLSLIGMLLLGSVGLWRSYRTTLRIYRGEFESGRRAHADTKPVVESNLDGSQLPNLSATPWVPSWLEKSVPGASEQQAAVAWLSLRNMTRAPEVKLALVAPIVVVILVVASLLFGRNDPISLGLRPLVGLGVCFFAMVGVSQLIQNQFGFDRDGFRALLLAPISERDILIAKNISFAPIALALGLVALFAMQVCCPLSWSHFLANIVQLLTMYLVACLVGNLMSIVVPQAIAAGSLKPTNLKFESVVLQFLIFLLAPLGMLPALLPLNIELLVADSPRLNWLPIYLLGAIFYLVLMGLSYNWLIGRQAKLLAQRKWLILETITQISS